MHKIVPVILAGGAGTRLWPASRDSFPKQFQSFFGGLSTYQQTLKRVSDRNLFEKPVVLTSDHFRFFADRQARDLGLQLQIILEPERRDSAAAVAAATVFVDRFYPGATVMVLAADHVILDDERFLMAVHTGLQAVNKGYLVVFGLVPTAPRTSYGYICPGSSLLGSPDLAVVNSFIEKPSYEKAVTFTEKGYLWNSGNFLFRTDVMLEELTSFSLDILEAARKSVEALAQDLGFLRLDPSFFSAAPKTSLDYAVIERTRRIAVVRGHFQWSDIGDWDAVWNFSSRDKHGNVVDGDGFAVASTNCLLHSQGVMTTLIGVDGLAVIATADAVLVVPRDQAQEVKSLVESLRAQHRPEVGRHRRQYRPWGYIEAIDSGDRFAVQRIVVDPGGVLSLQRHQHRAEHWVVVNGTATIEIEDQPVRILTINQSAYVPVGAIHRLSNRGKIPLELIEVQSGLYISDDDIERVEAIGLQIKE